MRSIVALALVLAGCTGSRATGTPDSTEPEIPIAVAGEGSGAPAGEGSGLAAVPEEPPPPPEPVCELGTPDGKGGCIVTAADRRGVMSAEERWDYLMTHCPDEEYGSFADTWVWDPMGEEPRMAGFDLDGEGTTFDFLSDFEGTSIIIRVREAETREKLAVIKTTSSNTRIEGEIYAHRLSVFLGFVELVPDVLPVRLEGGALEKLRDLLESEEMRDENKERNRRRVLRSVVEAIESGGHFAGAMKPWLRAFIFHSGLGHRESLAESDVMYFLTHGRRQPTDEQVRLRQYTRMYEPLGTHQGYIEMWQLAEDLSNIMLMDALTGQNDRFPGANLHFMSIAGEEVDTGRTRRNRPIFDMGEVRLLALDNGASMHSTIGTGIADLQGNVVGGTRVERFERESIDRLQSLARRLLGHGCETAPFEDEVEAIWTYFHLPEAEDRELATGYLVRTMEYIDELIDDQDGEIYVEPVITIVPEGEGSGDPAAGDQASIRNIDGEE